MYVLIVQQAKMLLQQNGQPPRMLPLTSHGRNSKPTPSQEIPRAESVSTQGPNTTRATSSKVPMPPLIVNPLYNILKECRSPSRSPGRRQRPRQSSHPAKQASKKKCQQLSSWCYTSQPQARKRNAPPPAPSGCI